MCFVFLISFIRFGSAVLFESVLSVVCVGVCCRVDKVEKVEWYWGQTYSCIRLRKTRTWNVGELCIVPFVSRLYFVVYCFQPESSKTVSYGNRIEFVTLISLLFYAASPDSNTTNILARWESEVFEWAKNNTAFPEFSIDVLGDKVCHFRFPQASFSTQRGSFGAIYNSLNCSAVQPNPFIVLWLWMGVLVCQMRGNRIGSEKKKCSFLFAAGKIFGFATSQLLNVIVSEGVVLLKSVSGWSSRVLFVWVRSIDREFRIYRLYRTFRGFFYLKLYVTFWELRKKFL